MPLLSNDAAVAGPLVIGGLDDDFTGRADLPGTLLNMRDLRGAPILLSHTPDPFAQVPAGVGLTLAGHTHCGQIVFPGIGPLATISPKLGFKLALIIAAATGSYGSWVAASANELPNSFSAALSGNAVGGAAFMTL